jgi:hypothetical protein
VDRSTIVLWIVSGTVTLSIDVDDFAKDCYALIT